MTAIAWQPLNQGPGHCDLAAALVGDRDALGRLAAHLLPVVRGQVRRVLARQRAAIGRDREQEVDDLTQEVFVALLERRCHTLRQWDPARGRSLASFVALVAERRVISVLRARRSNPWTARPEATPETFADPPRHPEHRLAARRELDRLVHVATTELTPLGQRLFHRLMLQQAPVQTIAVAEDMTLAAVYAWRSRLRRHLSEAPPSVPETPRSVATACPQTRMRRTSVKRPTSTISTPRA